MEVLRKLSKWWQVKTTTVIKYNFDNKVDAEEFLKGIKKRRDNPVDYRKYLSPTRGSYE